MHSSSETEDFDWSLLRGKAASEAISIIASARFSKPGIRFDDAPSTLAPAVETLLLCLSGKVPPDFASSESTPFEFAQIVSSMKADAQVALAEISLETRPDFLLVGLTALLPSPPPRVTKVMKEWLGTLNVITFFEEALNLVGQALPSNEGPLAVDEGLPDPAQIARSFLERALSLAVPQQSSLTLLVSLLKAQSQGLIKVNDAVQLKLMDSIANLLGESAGSRPDIDASKSIGRLLSGYPFLSSGGRTAVIAALLNSQSLDEASPIWWRGIDWEALEILATSPLAPILTREPASSEIVGPLVEKHAETINTRAQLAALLGAGNITAPHISPEFVKTAIGRISPKDKWLKIMLGAISQEHIVNELSQQLALVKQELGEANKRDGIWRRQVGDLESSLDECHKKANEIRAATQGLNSSQLSQARLDGMRLAAQVIVRLDEVFGIDNNRIQAIDERIQALAERNGLSYIARPGEVVLFDSQRFSPLGFQPNPGDTVHVERSGIAWTTSIEELILIPAQVTSIIP